MRLSLRRVLLGSQVSGLASQVYPPPPPNPAERHTGGCRYRTRDGFATTRHGGAVSAPAFDASDGSRCDERPIHMVDSPDNRGLRDRCECLKSQNSGDFRRLAEAAYTKGRVSDLPARRFSPPRRGGLHLSVNGVGRDCVPALKRNKTMVVIMLTPIWRPHDQAGHPYSATLWSTPAHPDSRAIVTN